MDQPRPDDAERHTIEGRQIGGPVDPLPVKTTFADIVTDDRARPPIVPAYLRNRDQFRAFVRSVLALVGYNIAAQAWKSPKYLFRSLLWAPVGAGRLLLLAWRWAYDLEQWGERQHAANKNDVEAYMTLMKEADRHRRGRVPIFFAVLALLLTAGVLVWWLGPWWLQAATVTATVAVFARAGRPADKPILERTIDGPRFTRLTAEQVRTALCSIGVGIKDPASLTFPQPGISRDGRIGFIARVNLPAGITAVKVLEKREELSSAMRLPVDQVWPSVGPEHAGMLHLWVGVKPASQMGHAKWALASPTARTSAFEPIPFGVNQRQQPVTTTVFQRNYLIGGQPGSGKTFAGRAIVLGVLLDPLAEVWLAAFKPSEDFHDVAEFCTRYECGVDTATMDAAQRMVADGLREVHRRQTLLGKLKREGRIAEGRTDPDLASKGIGLHQLVLVFDEVHELFLESKQAIEDMIRLIKQGRSAGVSVVLITQVADKDSVPPNVTRCVSSRWCLSVADQVANDQVMGTGSYKRGQSGVAYRPRVDAGWGATSGMSDDYDGPVRAYYPDEDELRLLLDRIRLLRGGGTFTTGSDPDAPRRDVLTDVLKVFSYAGRPGLQWQQLAELLAEHQPDAYEGITPEAISATLRGHGVPSVDVKIDGRGLKGCRRAEIDAAIERREIEGGSRPS